jgi:hypothetical protein
MSIAPLTSTATYDSGIPKVLLAPERLARMVYILDRMRDVATQDWRANRDEFLQLHAELNALIPPP